MLVTLTCSVPLTSPHLFLWGLESSFSSKNKKTVILPVDMYFQARLIWHGMWYSSLEERCTSSAKMDSLSHLPLEPVPSLPTAELHCFQW